jgi:hypothetical protein
MGVRQEAASRRHRHRRAGVSAGPHGPTADDDVRGAPAHIIQFCRDDLAREQTHPGKQEQNRIIPASPGVDRSVAAIARVMSSGVRKAGGKRYLQTPGYRGGQIHGDLTIYSTDRLRVCLRRKP